MPEANTPDLTWLVVSAPIGTPVAFEEVPVRRVEAVPGGYGMEVFRKRKWVSALVSDSRLGVPSVSIYQGRIEGDVWCRSADADAARTALSEAVRACIEAEIGRLHATMDGLDAPTPDALARR